MLILTLFVVLTTFLVIKRSSLTEVGSGVDLKVVSSFSGLVNPIIMMKIASSTTILSSKI